MSSEKLGRAPVDNLSHVMGDTSQPLWEKTIPQLLAETVAKHGDREAVVFCAENLRWTWKEFAEEVDALASGLHALGLKKGERIGIWGPNRHEWLLTQFATARLGLIMVNINPAYRVFELEFALNKVGCSALITAPNFKTSNYVGMLQELALELESCEPGKLRSAKLPELKTLICMGDDIPKGMHSFDKIMDKGRAGDASELDRISKSLDPNDPINIQFTSGTTGLPKGACLTHRNIVNNARFVTDAMEFTHEDRLCIPVPLYHCFGMVMGTLGCVTKGAAMVFPGEGFDPADTVNALAGEKCTAVYGVPTMYVAQLQVPGFEELDLSAMRTGIMSGAPCPVELMKNVREKMHIADITICYGMTETSPVSFQTNIDDPVEKRVASVGRVLPHAEVKIIDETGETVPVGEQGEICTRGYCVMRGYWNDEERTAESIDAEGWMHTGDLGTLDEGGYGKITGRVKDMIVRGGENIYPREIEDFLHTHPAVANVQVFGVPDKHYGEVVCCWIVKAAGADASEEEIRQYCKDKIAHFKVPAHIRFKDDLPLTVTGKPQKFVMSDEMAKELGVEKEETA